jgi:methionine-rich copper-binding protein CopC
MRRAGILLTLIVVATAPTSALAHGETTTTDPAQGARVNKAPRAISIDFSEPPTNDSKYAVVDGCGEDVFAGVRGDGEDKVLSTSGGEPGKWTVSYRVISATDGHLTRDRFSFAVAGNKDCNAAPAGDETPDIGDALPPVASDDGGSDFPVMPVLIGGGIILVLAIAVRVSSSR